MRFASLGSGSRGNALVVEAAGTRVLVDCGFGLRTARVRLARLGLAPEDLHGLLLTHEHEDHVCGALRLAERSDVAVWATHGTLAAAAPAAGAVRLRAIEAGTAFCVGGIEILPFSVPHDAREPVQFVFSDGGHRLGVLTDTGWITPHVETVLDGCDALILECNHDLEMLRRGDYPPALKARIAGRFGHLDNQAAAGLLCRVDRCRLQHVVAAHLSERNNRPELARSALAGALGCAPEWIGVANQDDGLAWRALG
jgi:phosphoribosyl 1,2-cyclic phosphodiesterase